MVIVRGRSISIMVLFTITLHLSWSLLILFDPTAVNATAVNALYRFVHHPQLLAGILLTTSAMAFIGMCSKRLALALLLVPQQVLLMMSAGGAADAVWLSQFADGVIRSRAFLAADEIYSILAAVAHTGAIMVHVLRLRAGEAASRFENGR